MKQQFSPVSLSSSNSTDDSNLDHPLAAFFGSLILVAVVTIHFYALGAKSDPSVLAYNESDSWQLPDASPAGLASASQVLFSRRDFSSLNASLGSGTILDASSTIQPAHSRGFGLGTSPSDSSGLEAALLVLNFGN